MINEYLNTEKGSALILVLFLVAIVAVSASAILLTNYYSTKHSVIGERKADANFRAQGGVEEAIQYINHTLQTTGTLSDHSFSRADWYDVVIDRNGDSVTIDSTADYSCVDGIKQVSYSVTGKIKYARNIGGYHSPLFNYVLISPNPIYIRYSMYSSIIGDVSGDIEVGNIEFLGLTISPYLELDGNLFSPPSEEGFLEEFQLIKDQVNFEDTVSFPASFPEGLTGELIIEGPPYTEQVFEGDIYKDKIYIESSVIGNAKARFKGDVYTNLLEMQYGADVVFEGTVYAKAIRILPPCMLCLDYDLTFEQDVYAEDVYIYGTGDIDFKQHLLVDGDITLKHISIFDTMKIVVDEDVYVRNFIVEETNSPFLDLTFKKNFIADNNISLDYMDDFYVGGLILANNFSFNTFEEVSLLGHDDIYIPFILARDTIKENKRFQSVEGIRGMAAREIAFDGFTASYSFHDVTLEENTGTEQPFFLVTDWEMNK